MADCEKLPKCAFFNDRMANMPATADVVKWQFCRGDFRSCARYMVATTLGADAVPLDLFPIEQDRARALVRGAGSQGRVATGLDSR